MVFSRKTTRRVELSFSSGRTVIQTVISNMYILKSSVIKAPIKLYIDNVTFYYLVPLGRWHILDVS